jgi:ubiquinone/menaquinone biosynthesis C-methylase UbiE
MPKIEPFQKHTIKYDRWFEENKYAYQSEVNAIKELLPVFNTAVEIGVGSGKFAIPLGIKFGIEPSEKMRNAAKKRGIVAVNGTAENLPLDSKSFDLALMVTTLCFLDDVPKAFSEIYRILKPGGNFINAFVDQNSTVGKIYQKYKEKSIFYKLATFYSAEEVISLLKDASFHDMQFRQTTFQPLDKINNDEPVKEGYGVGSFVTVRAQK